MNCKKCGTKVGKDDIFCTNCGEKIEREETKTAEKVEVEVIKNEKKESNGLAIAGMVLGICGLLLSFIFGFLALLLPILGLIFSIVAKGNKGFKITGIITSILAIIVQIIILIISIALLGSVFSFLGNFVGDSIGGLKAYEPYGTWTCEPYDSSYTSKTYDDEDKTSLILNVDGTYKYGPYNDLTENHYSGTFTFETEDDKNEEYASQGYKFIYVKGEVDEFKQNGKIQSTYGKSLELEMELFEQYDYDKALIIFPNTYNMYMCER